MVKVNAGSLSTMASTVSNASASRSSALSQAMSSFHGLLSEGNLKGKAYDSARNYSSNVLIPLLQGMILYTEALGENASELQTLYASYCGGESLDSEDLERDIQSYESSLRSAQNMCRLLEKDPTATHSMVSSSRAYATKLQADLTDLREKLRHLYAFNNASSSVFSDMADDPKKSNDLASMISGGISQVSTDFASFSASAGFPRRDKTKMGWSKDISKQWKQRNELIDAYKAATEKLKNGKTLSKDEAEAIRKYAKKYPTKVPEYVSEYLKGQEPNKKTTKTANTSINYYEEFKKVMDSDTAKRLGQLFGLLPSKFTESVLASDGLWEILASVEKSGVKGSKAVDAILEGLSKYEGLRKSGALWSILSKVEKSGVKGSKAVDAILEGLSKVHKGLDFLASPVKEGTKWGLEKVSGFKSLEKAVQTGKNLVGDAKFLGKGIKFLGKVGTVATFAELGFEGISGGIEEYSKSKDIGKAVGKGALSAVSSVGPLEGATIGATIGSAVPVVGTTAGAVVGGIVGGAIQITKWIEPDFFDDPVKGTKNIVNKAGKAIKGATDAVSDAIGGFGKALGFG